MKSCGEVYIAIAFSLMLTTTSLSQGISGNVRSRNQETGSIEGTISVAGGTLGIRDVVVSAVKDRTRIATMSNEQGQFVLKGLEPGAYFIRAEHVGYVGQTYGQRLNNRRGVAVGVAAGQRVEKIDFHLLRSAVITGRVIGADNEPLVEAFVQALTFRYLGGERKLVTAGAATANDLGEYRIYGLAPDRYYVVAVAPQSARARRNDGVSGDLRYLPTFYGNVGSSRQAVPVEASPGSEMRGIDISELREQTHHIRGQIAIGDKTSRFIQIQLLSSDSNYSSGERATDSDGKFDIGGVFPGSYLLHASFHRDGLVYNGWLPIEMGDADLQEVRVLARPPVNVSGAVLIEDGKNGSVALDKLTLRLTPDLSDPALLEGLVTKITADGRIAISGVYNRTYQLTISGLSDNYYLKSVRFGQEGPTEGTLNLTAAGGAVTDLEVVISSDGGAIDGVVKGKQDAPAQGAVVNLVPNGGLRSRYLFRETVADQSGRFSLKGIAPGEYKLFAWEDIESGAAEDPMLLKRYDNEGVVVTIESNRHETRDLQSIAIESLPR